LQVLNFESHVNNVTAVGFQCDGKWMYSGSEDGTVKIWDLRYGHCLFIEGKCIPDFQSGRFGNLDCKPSPDWCCGVTSTFIGCAYQEAGLLGPVGFSVTDVTVVEGLCL
jgi:WD40 repeat protein